HSWGAAAINIIARCMAGVTPLSHGFKTVRIAPDPAGLENFDAEVPTAKGPVKVRCTLNGGRYKLEVETPVAAEIAFGGKIRSVSAGKYIFH
ncbi:MAG: hypothetical protein J6R80_06265, partial [Kiritimatiellae bacterium]|nr:hypothetical protein [Kiritimatiellia bacterium]